ncbi:MAG: hypothetical protein JWN17_3148 [Frankiales bacterium]|nr:hypothetical protein [Frankiales bacterium]
MSPALPSRTPSRTLARTAPAALALALAVGLTGCGAGLRAQTYQERATADATNEAIGAIDVRNMKVLAPTSASQVYPVGSDARVSVVLVNNGTKQDTLSSATSTGATGVAVVGSDLRPTTLVLPGQSTATQYAFVLRGLTRELRPGEYVQMQLTFADNGSETMLVPVEVTSTAAPRPSSRSDYKVAETDSTGKVIPEPESTQGASGADAPETTSDPIGDENGGASAATPPPAR